MRPKCRLSCCCSPTLWTTHQQVTEGPSGNFGVRRMTGEADLDYKVNVWRGSRDGT